MIPWWMDNSELASFCDWLRLRRGAGAEMLIAVIREPWSWHATYQQFLEDRRSFLEQSAQLDGPSAELGRAGQAA